MGLQNNGRHAQHRRIPRAENAGSLAPVRRAPGEVAELVWLLLAMLIVCGVWALVYTAKVRRSTTPAPAVTLSDIDRAEKLFPCSPFSRARRTATSPQAASSTSSPITTAFSPTPAPSRASAFPAPTDRKSEARRTAQTRRGRQRQYHPAVHAGRIRPDQTANRRARFDVFRRDFLLWAGAILAAFLLTHIVWSVRGFTGPWAYLPLLLILTGIGYALMISLRDPLRDTLISVPFAQGVAAGCIVMLIASLIDWEGAMSCYSFVPLLGAIALSIALIFLGSGPAGSDARVNLGPFQPVEAIKILLVFFSPDTSPNAGRCCANYGKTYRWSRISACVEIPPLEYALPVLLGVGVALLFFYLQKDLGPALVFACVFLTLYAIARNRVPLAANRPGRAFGWLFDGVFPGRSEDRA